MLQTNTMRAVRNQIIVFLSILDASLAFAPFGMHQAVHTNGGTNHLDSIRNHRHSETTYYMTLNHGDNRMWDDKCDVLILGSGPAARALASLLASRQGLEPTQTGLDVLVSDTNFERKWVPNYGVWKDEWDSICEAYQRDFGVLLEKDCIDREWDVTDCYFGGSFDIPTESRLRIDRPYYRIAKNDLQTSLTKNVRTGQPLYRVLYANHISTATSINIYHPAESVSHDREGSTIVLKKANEDRIKVRSKVVIDCTGHETSLVLKDSRLKSIPCGYQIAYGALVTVDETNIENVNQLGPYDKQAMTLFDYRTDHFDKEDPSVQRRACASPTFMYAMPLKENRVFFEETSLVARPALSFQECKDRFFTRMNHLGITIKDIEEEEFCYIPMGGPLPEKDQRIIAFGGATAMSHPSTGYTLCRNMMSAVSVATLLRSGLLQENVPNLDQLVARAYDTVWSPSNIRQRNFAVFGGEFLMKQNVEGLRGFFDGFFRLPLNMWAGFLAGWPGLPNNEAHETWLARIVFGISFLSKLPFPIAVDMILSIITYSVSEGVPLLQSVTPFFGEPESYTYKERPKFQGDVAAKSEARKMILESRIEMDIPVDFSESTNTADKLLSKVQ